MKKIFSISLILNSLYGLGQTKDTIQPKDLQDVIITSYREKKPEETSINISLLRVDSLTRLGNFNLTDLLAKTPGVSMLSTGVAIAKPVIRGLYGNRVLVLLNGLKFDNQQWQEEHGLGLSDLGLSKVELIKGPLGVLYGTEAMGGIIHLVEEQKPAAYTRETDISLKFNTNTLGGLLQAGTKANHGNRWYRLRVGIENNADYSDGNGTRVLNSRFDGYYLKGTYGFQKKNWVSVNNLSSSYNRFGFIFPDIYDFIQPDDRWSRDLSDYPSHQVLLNILSSENKFILKDKSTLNLHLGFQSNIRMENEGGGAISLNMHLFTFQYLLKWEKQIGEKHTLILSHLGSFEDNTNYGSRKIVPDANMQEGNLSFYDEYRINGKWSLENGAGIGEKWIQTYFTPTVNGPGKELTPFSKFKLYYNFYSGVNYLSSPDLNMKLNLATGVRIPNLAELSSDGLHEGVFTYEIGSPDLKNEQNFTANFFLVYHPGIFEISLSPFFNYFLNYVYLAPTTEEWFGYPVYRYRQQNARQFGGEVTATIHPVNSMEIAASYSGMCSKTEDGNYTPYIPAHKITPMIQYVLNMNRHVHLNLYTNADYCLAQDHVYPNEVSTPSYFILNAGLSTNLGERKVVYELSLAANNLLDEAYYDHLSRFKYFGLLNIGRNIALTLKMRFQGETGNH